MYQTGTHGSVGGRLANQSSASYPILCIKSVHIFLYLFVTGSNRPYIPVFQDFPCFLISQIHRITEPNFAYFRLETLYKSL